MTCLRQRAAQLFDHTTIRGPERGECAWWKGLQNDVGSIKGLLATGPSAERFLSACRSIAPKDASNTSASASGEQFGGGRSLQSHVSAPKQLSHRKQHDSAKRGSAGKQSALSLPQDGRRRPSQVSERRGPTHFDLFQLGMPPHCVQLDFRLRETTAEGLSLDARQHWYGVANGDDIPQQVQLISHLGLSRGPGGRQRNDRRC